jgi:cysteine desulfurase
VLYVRDGSPYTPLLAGGGQEGGARGGTENLPGVAAIASVMRALLDRDSHEFADRATLLAYRERLTACLQKAFPKIVYNTPFENSVPTTINFAVPGVTGKELLDLFDAAGIRVSSGSACGSAVQGSYVLEAMGLPQWQSDGAIRLSFGPATTATDIEAACLRIEEAGTAIADACLLVSPKPHGGTVRQFDGLLQLKMGSMCSWILCNSETRKCVVVDPFAELLERIETIIRCQELQVVAVLDTHQHVDHESPRELLVKIFGDSMVDPNAATDTLGWPNEPEGEITLGDATQAPFISLSDSLVIVKSPLPGHTVDGQAFLVGEPNAGQLEKEKVRFAFLGDTLLIGGIGRTDFATSAAESLMSSLRKLPLVIADHTIVCPTHDCTIGFVTTLESERRHNRLLEQILDSVTVMSVESYLAIKQEVDGEIDDGKNCELVCGRIQNYQEEGTSSVDVEPEQLKEFFKQRRDALFVDVREAHEIGK